MKHVWADGQLSAVEALMMASALLEICNAVLGVRVRITERPRELDIEGVRLDRLRPGSVCDVSAAVGSWLIVKGYAYPEMRRTHEDSPADQSALPDRRRK